MCLVAATATAVTTATTTAVAATTTAAATATAVTAAATTTVAATTAAAEATATGSAWFHGAGFVDYEVTATKVLTMHALDSGLCFGIAAHFDKAKALRAAGVTFHHHLGAGNGAVLAEGLFQIAVTERVGQVAHVKFVAHKGLLKKHENAMESDAINKPVTTSKTRN